MEPSYQPANFLSFFSQAPLDTAPELGNSASSLLMFSVLLFCLFVVLHSGAPFPLEKHLLDLSRSLSRLPSVGSDSKESAYNAGDLGLIPGSGSSPGEGNGNTLQYSCLENSHGQRSLANYSPWGCKESDMTEQLTLLSGVFEFFFLY